jgi:apyrase
MPRAGPSALDLHTGATSRERRFAVVIDAGSTGSRVHAFEFAVSGTKHHLELLNDHFTQLKPGLSSFAADPAAGAASLKPLLEAALAAVPPLQAAVTPIEVRATAGLRLLPGAQAEQLLSGESSLLPCRRALPFLGLASLTRAWLVPSRLRAAVREELRGYPFVFGEDSVSILGGADEGAFQWLTLNYLLGNLGGRIQVRACGMRMRGRQSWLSHSIACTSPHGGAGHGRCH